jgi:hypothetical protein
LNDYTADGTIFDFMAGVRKVSWHWYNEATITRIKKSWPVSLFTNCYKNIPDHK